MKALIIAAGLFAATFAAKAQVATSTAAPGMKYAASGQPSFQASGYHQGQVLAVIPDVATLPGATLAVDGLQPVPIQGTCEVTGCLMMAIGSPVNALVVH